MALCRAADAVFTGLAARPEDGPADNRKTLCPHLPIDLAVEEMANVFPVNHTIGRQFRAGERRESGENIEGARDGDASFPRGHATRCPTMFSCFNIDGFSPYGGG